MSCACNFVPIETIFGHELSSIKSFDAAIRVSTLHFWTCEWSWHLSVVCQPSHPSQRNVPPIARVFYDSPAPPQTPSGL